MRKVKQYKGWKIYKEDDKFFGYLPGWSPIDSDAEWETDSLEEMMEFIDEY